jgi:predicted nucleic acid-binding protein
LWRHELQDVSADPDDDKYFAAAMEGSATLIVTGDSDLLTVKEYRGIRVVRMLLPFAPRGL